MAESTLRGMDAWLSLGGVLIGAPLVNGAVAPAATTMNVDAASLLGVSMPGDTFVVGGNTYTVTSVAQNVVANALTAVTFTPGAIGGFADNAVITYVSNTILGTRNWSLTPELLLLNTTVQQDKWYTCRSAIAKWSGGFEALLDLSDSEQAELFAKVTGATPEGAVAALLFGLQAGLPRDLYGAAVVNNGVVTSQLRDLVTLTMQFESTGQLSINYV